ncbi:MAG: PDZ domain-containing protein [Woeseiaceae bacterium]|nr:PDZ domain-containing protein [Woeseiaceae bacterium]
MIRIMISAMVGICLGLAAAAFFPQTDGGYREFVPPEPVAVGNTECSSESNPGTASASERNADQRLRQEIERLESEIARLSASPPDPLGGQVWLQQAWAELAAEENPEPDRQQQLVEGGFEPSRASWLAQRETELQQDVVSDHDGVMLPDHLETRLMARQALRAEIGDYEYERYLAATGQSTVVAVTQVLPDSAAEAAGLQVGDEIVDYDGLRVFNVFELSDASDEGRTGESVIVNIERDGAPMQLVLPRGALGISAGKPMR